MAFPWEKINIFDASLPPVAEPFFSIDPSRPETPLSIVEQINRNQIEVARLMALRNNEYTIPSVDPQIDIDRLNAEIVRLQEQLNAEKSVVTLQ